MCLPNAGNLSASEWKEADIRSTSSLKNTKNIKYEIE